MQLKLISEKRVHTLAVVSSAASLLLAAALVGTWVYGYQILSSNMAPPSAALLSSTVPPPQVNYQLDVPGRGEIFPALVSANATDYWPVAMLTIANLSDHHLLDTVTAVIPDVSQRFTETVVLGPRETRTVRIDVVLTPVAFSNTEMRKVILEVHAGSPGHQAEFAETHPVFLHAVSDIYWGRKFANAQFIARWVTPHNPAVIQLVSAARKYVPRGRLAGYQLPSGKSRSLVAAQVRGEARAVYQAMSKMGISYVDSLYTFGNFTSVSERVRLPRETLLLESANCIDVSVAYASAMENLGMHPVIVIVPGHAFTGVRLGPDSGDTLYVDLTVLPNGTFQQAVDRAGRWLKKTPPNQLLMIDIPAARSFGIYPMPETIGEQTM